jgi:xylulokinase
VGAIGAGNYKPGLVSETTGSAVAIQVTVPHPFIDSSKTVPVYYHSVPGKYLLVPVCPTAGMAFKWFRDQFGQNEIKEAQAQNVESYELMTALAEKIPAGADGLIMLPHLMGAFSPRPNSQARGSFTGFTLSHTRSHFVRAVLEGVAFMLKQNIQYIQAIGLEVRRITATGGGARSQLWNQIKANVCNMPVVTLKNEETALVGDAILATVACGMHPSIEDACRCMVVTREVIEPNHEVQAYVEPYRRYCELDQRLSDYFRHSYSPKA